MFLFAGLVFGVDLLFPVVPPLLQYVAFGAVFGVAGAREVVVRRERRGGEMPPDQVRRVERIGVAAGISLMLLAAVAQAVAAVL